MTVQIIDCEQGGPEWFAARLGLVTASMIDVVMSSPSGRGAMPGRRKYMLQLAGEIATGDPMESYSNNAMERGKAMEAEARSAYALITDAELTRVGFVVNDGLIKGRRIGVSPDAMIAPDGVLELKTQTPHLLIDRLLSGGFPTEHTAQCQGAMWIAEKSFCDLAVFWPRLPIYKHRVKRDDQFIARMKLAVSVFCEELDEIVDKIRRYGRS